ncbi:MULTISPECIES: response regulator [unclassified Pseudomonas]|uniref:response regulator n=1 Tax=unclassified Pseudomonas TaxID=196821 RepID=UPI001A9FC997|nr:MULTISPECIES: response regulator [unclassified Pseudomonas]
MDHDPHPLGALAISSVRQNRNLLVLGFLVVTCLILLFKTSERLVNEEKNKLNIHFSEVINSLQENENFLLDISNQYRLPTDDLYVPGGSQSVIIHEVQHLDRKRLFRGSGLNVSIPFTLATSEIIDQSRFDSSVKFTVRIAAYYANFWSSSDSRAPQLILVSQDPDFSIAIPATDYTKIGSPLEQDKYLDFINTLRHRMLSERLSINDSRVWWSTIGKDDQNTLFGLILVNMKNGNITDPLKQFTILSTSFNIKESNYLTSKNERLFYDQFTLISPTGATIFGPKLPTSLTADGLTIDSAGFHFTVSSDSQNSWKGIYSIGFISFLQMLQIPLIGIIFIALISTVLILMINNWYNKNIVQPAETAHSKLLESQKFITDVIDSAPTGLSIVRRADRTILLENQSARTWGGTTELLDLIYDQPESTELCIKVKQMYLQVFFVPTRYRGEQVILCAFIDITQHRHDNTELAKAKNSADQASNAKTLFLATMSHEIRTPLYGVLGNLELLSLTDLGTRQKEYLKLIQNSSSALSSIISDVLDVSKIESGQFVIEVSPFSPTLLAEEVVSSLKASADLKNISLDLTLDPRLPKCVLGDDIRIKQILLNLLNNAIKFTEEGRVNLHINVVNQCKEMSTICWQVTDTGVGIPKDQQLFLFQPFYQANGGGKLGGAGLGLAICAKLSQLLGGNLRVLSDVGVGSSFFLKLPLKILDISLPEQNIHSKPSINCFTNESYKVLIAEDNDINRSILETQLKILGLQVTSAIDGKDALNAWHQDKFDLVITDVNMPNLNGYALTRELRAHGAQVPIIGVTANAMLEEKQLCIESGMNACIVKPISIENLKHSISELLFDKVLYPSTLAPQDSSSLTIANLSNEMKVLFYVTTTQDINQALDALNNNRQDALIIQLHKICGAYAAIGEKNIAEQFLAYENRLKTEHLNSSLDKEVKEFLLELDKDLQLLKR